MTCLGDRQRISKPSKSQGKIPRPTLDDDELVRFSFRHASLTHPKFCLDRCDRVYFLRFLERVRDLSRMTVLEIRANRSKTLRLHSISWGSTTETGFGLGEEIDGLEPYQFSMSANELGRVHGFWNGTVFHVVWFDPNHELYRRER